MTADEFRKLLADKADVDMLRPCLTDAFTPFAFDLEPNKWVEFRGEVGERLNVPSADITVVGSGDLG